MWRFNLISFAFLGWAFYVISGGADYQPRTQSIQARAKLDDVRPVPRPVKVAVLQLDAGDIIPEPIERDADTPDPKPSLVIASNERLDVVLASVATTEITRPKVKADVVKSQDLTTDKPQDTPQITAPLDMRKITGSAVNLRDGPSIFYLAIASLKKDTAVEVLEDSGEGWLKVRVAETGQIGWTADWLVTAAN